MSRNVDQIGRAVVVGSSFIMALLLTDILLASSSSAETERQVGLVARAELHKELAAIPPSEMGGFGFASVSELGQAKPGSPIRALSWDRDRVLSGTRVSEIGDLLSVNEYWIVPVFVGDELRTVMHVSTTDGRCEVVGLGGTVIAQEIRRLFLKLKDTSRLPSGFAPVSRVEIIGTEDMGSALFRVSGVEGELLYPTQGALKVLDLRDELLWPDEVLAKLVVYLGESLSARADD